ncbi:MAG: hypothetical protein IJS20_00445 [Bacteroidales bacterium]|nr:hypothetical protein [Bacteroidales bacterium]
MRLKTLLLSLVFVCPLLLASCGAKQERDYLYELLRDFEARPFGYNNRTCKLACFDENSVDSTFITLIIDYEGGDSIPIRLINGTPHLCLGNSEPPPPPPPPMPDVIEPLDSADVQELSELKSLYKDERTEEEREREWLEYKKMIEHLEDSLGHHYGPELRGMICEGRLRVLVYGYPEKVIPSFFAGHKLQYNSDIFRYMDYKEAEVADWMIEYYNFRYVVDSVGNLNYRGYR